MHRYSLLTSSFFLLFRLNYFWKLSQFAITRHARLRKNRLLIIGRHSFPVAKVAIATAGVTGGIFG
jgi:hypothetical protein